jgi:hypothetical protein
VIEWLKDDVLKGDKSYKKKIHVIICYHRMELSYLVSCRE